MKKASEKIARIVVLAAAEERNVGQQTGKSQRHLSDNEHRLDELIEYRRSYKQATPKVGNVCAAHWNDYQRFLQKLDQAVSAQHQIVRDSENNLKLHRERWMAKRRRLESLERVLERHTSKEIAREGRLEQKRLDDMSTRARKRD